MLKKKLAGAKIKELLGKYGSLDAATERREKDKAILEEEVAALIKTNAQLKVTRDGLLAEIHASSEQLNGQRRTLEA